jgi:hypothetical protein
VARAKRTDRADARRRYRGTQSEAASMDGGAAESLDTASESPAKRPPAPARSGASARPATSDRSPGPAGQRPSFTAAFRAASRPIDVRSDIAYIPTLTLRTRAVWIPALAAIASGAVFLAAQPLGSNALANLAFQLFVLPPTIAGAFLAGILAPRATYIAGGIAALVGALVFAVAVLVTPSNLSAATIAPAPSAVASASDAASASAAPSASAQPSASPAAASTTDTTKAATDADKASAIVQSIILSVPFGIAIGAFGGYYKRFLSVSNPNRQRRIAEQQRQKTSRPKQPGRRY